MAKCKRCGKSGLFLKLSSSGYCDECSNVMLAEELTNLKIKQLEEEKSLLLMGYARECVERFGWLPGEQSCGHRLKYKYDDVQLYVPDDFDLDEFASLEGFPVFFIREDDNVYDERAILAFSETGKPLGYIYRGGMQDMIHDFMDEGLPIISVLESVDSSSRNVSLSVFFYR